MGGKLQSNENSSFSIIYTNVHTHDSRAEIQTVLRTYSGCDLSGSRHIAAGRLDDSYQLECFTDDRRDDDHRLLFH